MTLQKFDFRVREGTPKDAIPILELLKKNNYHSANLPQSLGDLHADLSWASDSFYMFRYQGLFPADSFWFFVLEEIKSKVVVGTALVKPLKHRLIYHVQKSADGRYVGTIAYEDSIENICEFGGFLLDASVRRLGLGKLLSLSRAIFLSMAHMPVRTLATEFMLKDTGRGFWERWCTEHAGLTSFDVEFVWRDPQRTKMLRDKLLPCIVFDYEESAIIEISVIRAESEPARNLLVKKLGFSPTGKIEADGAVWYETSGSDVQRKVESARIVRSAKRSDYPREVPLSDAIAAWRGAVGFEARCVPLAQGEDGETIFVDWDRCKIPTYAEIFAF